jgi:CRISPR-associated protein Cas2
MMVLITYDVKTETAEGRARLRRVAEACEKLGPEGPKLRI